MLKFEAEELAVLREFWMFQKPHVRALNEELRSRISEIAVFVEVLRSMTPAQIEEREATTFQLQEAALERGDWTPYLADLAGQGAAYAKMGIPFSAWFEVLALYRRLLSPRIEALSASEPRRAARVQSGLARWLDLAMGTIGDAYLATKEIIIRDQQEAIREISTPVLQIRDKILILPIVGLVDTHRARHITESVLRAVRARRARAVVMDVTGVPLVDSKVAKHLAQTCESARLMGASVIITGISQEIAQTLVTIGADLSSVRTLGDLQSGLEEAEHLVAALASPAAPTPVTPTVRS